MRVMLALLFLLCAYLAPVPSGADDTPSAKDILARAADAGGPIPENYRETIVGTGSLGATKTIAYHIGLDYTHGHIYLTPNAFGRRGTIH
jgi:hypothetical protein